MVTKELTVGSLFSGCGCFDLGFARAGFRVAWQVEIDPTARDVLARHFPGVDRYEDVRECGSAGTGRKHTLAPVDVICGGWPCQDLSVAGARGGITGERSGLFYELVRIATELRPRFLVFENVPGLFSSFTATEHAPDAVEGREWEVDETSDFESVLSHLAACGFHGGWRVLDARRFGVPQSRQRIFGVFTGERAGADDCAEILALADSVRRDFETRGQTETRVARSLTAGTGTQGHRIGAEETPNLVFTEQGEGHASYQEAEATGAQRAGGGGAKTANLAVYGGGAPGERGVCAALTGKAGTRQDFDTENFIAFQCHGSNVGPLGTLRKGNGDVNGGVPFVFHPQAAGNQTNLGFNSEPVGALGASTTPAVVIPDAAACLSGDGDPKGRDDDCAFTLTARERGHGSGMAVAVRTAQTSANGIGVQEGTAYALDQAKQAVCVTVPVTHTLTGEGHDASEDGTGRGTPIVTEAVSVAQNQRGELRTSSTAPAGYCGGGKPGEGYPAALTGRRVRRLTPRECERLMALPDDWTRYRDDGTEIADGPRYKLCGNGLIVNCAEWLATRTARALLARKAVAA